MNKSKHFIFAVMATAITLLIFGSRAASAQATRTGIINATPTPTNTPTEGSDIPGEIPSEEEQEEIKAVVREYVDVRYRALSVSDAEDFIQNGFGDLILTAPETEAFRSEEMAKLAVEIKRAEVYHLRYVSYTYSLNFEGITFDPRSQTAIVSMMESNKLA